MVCHQFVHNYMRAGPSVINIAHNMQVVDHQPLDEFRDGDNELLCPANADNRGNDLIIVGFLVPHFRFLRDQFLDHIGKIFRQRLSHLGPGIFAGRPFAHLDQEIKMDSVPVLHVRLRLFDDIHLGLWIIDQCGKPLLVPGTHRIAEHLVNFLSDRPGSVLKDMGKSLVFPVNICQEMLGPLGKVQYGLKIDDLRGCSRNGGVQI